MTWIWIGLIILVIILDVATSNVLFSWMSIGFLAALVSDQLGVPGTSQIIIACLVGSVFFMMGSIINKKFIQKRMTQTPILTDKIVGSSHRATKPLGEETQYKINGIYWYLRNDGPVIQPGEHFRIIGIKNNRLYITKEN